MFDYKGKPENQAAIGRPGTRMKQRDGENMARSMPEVWGKENVQPTGFLAVLKPPCQSDERDGEGLPLGLGAQEAADWRVCTSLILAHSWRIRAMAVGSVGDPATLTTCSLAGWVISGLRSLRAVIRRRMVELWIGLTDVALDQASLVGKDPGPTLFSAWGSSRALPEADQHAPPAGPSPFQPASNAVTGSTTCGKRVEALRE